MKTHEAILLFSKDFLANPESFGLRRKGMECYQPWEVPCHLKFWNRTYYWIERKSLIRDLAGKDCVWLLCVDNSCFWEWSLPLPSDHRNPPSGAGSHRVPKVYSLMSLAAICGSESTSTSLCNIWVLALALGFLLPRPRLYPNPLRNK